jgi:putative component of membrane protein insertase Oxa1/YidC/SpoIIIJ protein YidD
MNYKKIRKGLRLWLILKNFLLGILDCCRMHITTARCSRFLRPFSSKRHPSGCRADDCCGNYETNNATFLRKSQVLHQCRVKEDEAWKKSQVDPVVKQLQAADKQQDRSNSVRFARRRTTFLASTG